MNTNWLKRVGPVLLITATLSGCSTNRSASLGDIAHAAADKAISEVSIDIGPSPDECGFALPHAPLIDGHEAKATLKLERGAKDDEADSKRRCYEYHDQLRERLLQHDLGGTE